jgi:hypothetical protein
LTPWLTPLYNLGGFGCMLVLILTGGLWTKKAVEDLREDRDNWRKTAETSMSALTTLQSQVDKDQREREAQLERDKLTHQLLGELATQKAKT